VHNSGHWTIEGAETSQFENHLRAILGQPLGPAHLVRPSAMVNLIGDLSPLPALLETPGAHAHLYRKEPKPGRKIGHVTVGSGCPDELARLTARVAALTGAPWP
jgi:5-(carboxyamino)imidazole ribonucleotide synthase